ncbi:MAG: hypothetical protein VZQ47_06310 [Treponema sp.]|nr:hypothetical protein [Treponema sp.]
MKEYTEKFVAFIDILGFKNMVASSSATGKPSIEELENLQSILRNEQDQRFYKISGAEIAPCSKHIQEDLNFVVSQVSDSVIVSAEISPAGIINLIKFCWKIVFLLLEKGILCRGYIVKGNIYHEGNQFLGLGYNDAYTHESKVTFRKKNEEKAPPFVEIDPTICEYIEKETDDVVRRMFERFTKTEDGLTAIFPFQLIYSQDVMSDSAKESNNNVRKRLLFYKEKILENTKDDDDFVIQKINHYIRALDKQLEFCEKLDRDIDIMNMPFGEIYNG